jgi:hypothetical protein
MDIDRRERADVSESLLLVVAGTECSAFCCQESMWEARVSDAQDLRAVIGILLAGVAIATVLIGVVIFLTTPSAPPPNPDATINTSQSPDKVRLTMVDSGKLDSLVLVGPDGTQSSVFSSGFQPGTEITIRRNATVHSYLENNSVRIPADGGGFMTIDTPSDVTTTQLSLQEVGLSDTEHTPRTAYLACLYEPEEFELNGKSSPPNVSIPCHSPVLAQTDNIQPRTSTEQNGDTVTTPILLKEGEYYLVGILDGREDVVGSIEVSEETAGR